VPKREGAELPDFVLLKGSFFASLRKRGTSILIDENPAGMIAEAVNVFLLKLLGMGVAPKPVNGSKIDFIP
jgi:hypothetical protein